MDVGPEGNGIGITIEPDRFDEAIEEFLSRHIITGSDAAKIEGHAKRRAWWISGVAQMDIVLDAHKALEAAMENGTPFEEWQKQVEEKLTAAWGRPNSGRLITIFRNATMQAANAGRWEQMHQPHVLAARPYLEHDAVRDSRSCKLCKECHGIVLPADHPWWERMSPILHHGCRCGLKSHRASVAEERGITQELPDVQAGEGFGYPPTSEASLPPKPWERNPPPPPEIEVELAQKTAEFEQEAKRQEVKIKPDHDPEFWEPIYRERYGDAAKQMAWGRATWEKSQDMTPEELSDGLRDLSGELFPGIDRYANVGRTEVKYLAPKSVEKSAKLLVQHTRSIRRKVPDMTGPAGTHLAREEAVAFWSRMADSSLELPKVTWKVSKTGRSCFNMDSSLDGKGGFINNPTIRMARDVGYVGVHEYGHAIEEVNGISDICKEFIRARSPGESPQKLRDLIPGSGFRDDEVCLPDKLWSPYIGKIYAHNGSEVTSMVAEAIADGGIVSMIENDFDTVIFFFGLMAGVR